MLKGKISKRIFLIADQHGQDKVHQKILDSLRKQYSDCVTFTDGDFGYGFRTICRINDVDHNVVRTPSLNLAKDDFLIAGNHDHRSEMIKDANCIATTKYFPEYDIFVVPGAETPNFDKIHRTEGFTWFPDEELSEKECEECLKFYERQKPSIVISHEGPTEACLLIKSNLFAASRTRKLLDQMLLIHRPSVWYFGHWHSYLQIEICGTLFVCRPELQVFDLAERSSVYI